MVPWLVFVPTWEEIFSTESRNGVGRTRHDSVSYHLGRKVLCLGLQEQRLDCYNQSSYGIEVGEEGCVRV